MLAEMYGHTPHDLAAKTGLPIHHVRNYLAVAKVYFGPATSRKKQRLATEAARAAKHSLHTLEMLEKHIKKVPRRQQWALRLQLARTPGTYETLRDVAKKKVEALTAGKKPARKPTIAFSADRSTMHVTGNPHDIADLEAVLRRDLDPAQPAGPQMAEKYFDLIREGGVAHAAPTPIIQITLEEHARLIRDDGDEDVDVQLTNGTTMTGAEYVAAQFDQVEAVLVDRVRGPVDLYRTQRFASNKQRRMLQAVQHECCWDDCHVPSDYAQVHHVDDYATGGFTNVDRMMMLCKYHNGVNGHRGRMDYVNGVPTRLKT